MFSVDYNSSNNNIYLFNTIHNITELQYVDGSLLLNRHTLIPYNELRCY